MEKVLTISQVVQEGSATYASAQEDPNPLDYNHVEMCKVNSNEEECRHFHTILGPIQDQLEKALGILKNPERIP